MRTTSTQGVFHLAAGDKLIVIASTSGNTATTNTHTKVELETKSKGYPMVREDFTITEKAQRS